ncbi:MAG: HAD family hydrolase [Candidatus Eremiobacteraeota bacterium]|nr:HAD family hydrolase [Candidatus Eremiobacteraeota bacterium]
MTVANDRPPLAAVLFDLDDTLHGDTRAYHVAAHRVADSLARDYGIEAQTVFDAYVAGADRFWKTLSEETLREPLAGLRSRLWNEAMRAVGIDDWSRAERCGVEYNMARKESLEIWPGALELLASLRRRGLKLALITNGIAETHREKIALLQLEDAFDEFFIADEVGLIKPDPRVFRLAAQRLGVRTEACAMVGDRFERDVRGGHATGMFTVWMNVRDERVPAGGPQPDAIVTDVRDVEAALFGGASQRSRNR